MIKKDFEMTGLIEGAISGTQEENYQVVPRQIIKIDNQSFKS